MFLYSSEFFLLYSGSMLPEDDILTRLKITGLTCTRSLKSIKTCVKLAPLIYFKSSLTICDRTFKVCNFVVSAIIGNIFSAILTFFFALGLFISSFSFFFLFPCKWFFFSFLDWMAYVLFICYVLWSGFVGFLSNHWSSVPL